MLRIVGSYLTGDYTASIGNKTRRGMMQAAAVTRDVASAGAAACNFGANVRKFIYTDIRLPFTGNGIAGDLENASEAFEKLKISSMTPECSDAHRNIMTMIGGASDFRVNNTCAGRNLGTKNIYRIGPFFFLQYEDCTYCLYHAALEQVRDCTRFWAGSANCFWNYMGNQGLRHQCEMGRQ